MRTLRDPRQTQLFDPFDAVLTERTRKALLERRSLTTASTGGRSWALPWVSPSPSW